jgi:hypothetical protein
MKQKFNPVSAFWFVLPCVLIVMLLTGCESSNDSADASSAIQISNVTASPASISLGATVVIEAVVTDGSNPLSNRQITFSVDTAYGSCSPLVDTTNSSGIAATLFTSKQTGSVTVTATLPDGTSRSVSIEVTSQSQSGSGNIQIAILPTSIQANGTSTATVTITVLDALGQVAPDSTIVRLAAGEKFDDIDGNGYFTNGVDSVIYDVIANGSWDAVGSVPSDTFIISNGQVSVTYTSGLISGTVYIRATVTASGYDGFAEATVELTPDAAISSIFLAADSIHLAVKATGGMETSMLRAIGYDYNGNTVPEGMQISFIITDGPSPDPTDTLSSDDDEHLGNLTGLNRRGPYITTTNAMGVASCPISSGIKSGTIRVRAYTDSIMSTATQIMVHAGPPAKIITDAADCNVQYWDEIGRTVGVMAMVWDIYNNPCPDSTVVYFTCDEGIIEAHETRIMGEDGQTGTTWYSYGIDAEADGIVWIYAETNGGTLLDSGSFINSFFPDTIWFTQFPDTIYAHDKSDGHMYAQVRDLNMNYVTNCAEVKLEGDYVTFANREDGDGCYTSGIGADIVGNKLELDYSMNHAANVDDDGIGAIDYITVRYDVMASVVRPCTLLTGDAYRDNCQLSIENSTADYGERVYFTVSVKDRWTNPLGNHTIAASVDHGSITGGGTADTDEYGEAHYSMTMPDATSGVTDVTITVADIDPAGGITLVGEVTIPVTPTLNVNPTSLDFGSATTNLTFTISNSGTGGTVNWNITDDRSWISTDSTSGHTITETDIVTVTVDRTGLTADTYTGSVTVSSDAGSAIIDITMTVP